MKIQKAMKIIDAICLEGAAMLDLVVLLKGAWGFTFYSHISMLTKIGSPIPVHQKFF